MKLGAVILAAGSGMRLGGVAKALLQINERAYLEVIAATALEVGTGELLVVVGPPHQEAVSAHAHALGATIVTNLRPERGMASSIALGFAAMSEHAVDAAWLWPVDHPIVRPSTLRALLAVDGDVVRPRHDGRHGHPPLIRRAAFAALANCAQLPNGARDAIAALAPISVDVDDPGILADVDTPADVEALR